MNTRGVGESVRAHDSLVGLDGDAGEVADQSADRVDASRVDAGIQTEDVMPSLQRHDDFLKGGVSRALADAVDCDLHLPCAVQHTGERVGSGHTQIVVAVHGDGCPVDVGYVLDNATNQCTELGRRSVACCVGNVDHRSASVNHRLQNLIEVLGISPSRVLGVVLHVLHKLFGVLNGIDTHLEGTLARRAQLIADMHVRDL